MTPRETIFYRLRRFSALLLLFFAAAALALPVTAHGAGKNVRIGWYETPFNVMDKAGRRSGYAYEYQQKLAAYSGWNFTYVKGSWSELMQKLFDGEIDMMSDVSYTEERAKKILYPELPMGTEEYCIFIVPGNRDITSQDYSTLNGKRIGVYKNSVHADIFLRWAELHGIQLYFHISFPILNKLVYVRINCNKVEIFWFSAFASVTDNNIRRFFYAHNDWNVVKLVRFCVHNRAVFCCACVVPFFFYVRHCE